MNSEVIETLATTPYRIIGLLGGMGIPSVPPVEHTPAA